MGLLLYIIAPILHLLPETHWTISMDDACFKICILGTLNSMVTMTFFFGVHWNGHRSNSIANHKFYKALGRLHGPGVNNP